MPTVSVNKEALFNTIGRTYTDEEFDELCFKFGLEIDDVVDDPDKGLTYKIEIGANRYDLLCIEGIARSLRVYLGLETLPRFRVLPAKEPAQYRLIVKPATAQVRPYVVGAVLRNIKFTQAVYDSFIDLQDKLHHNIARKRTLVAIGTHDLDTITGPFIYDAQPPKDISFVPLNQTEVFRSDVLLEKYSQDQHLREFVPIIKDKASDGYMKLCRIDRIPIIIVLSWWVQDKPVYPVIQDQKGVVLSLPPIINGNHSKISLNTRNVFIECTATDRHKAQIVLDTLVCMFSGYCEKPFTAEAVQVEYPDGEKIQYPTLQYRQHETSVSYCNVLTGVEESAESMAALLKSMSLSAKPAGPDTLMVEVPPTRYDVLHACDVAEDFAVAYGFDRLRADMHLPATNTIGQEYELNYLTDKMRLLLSQNNYIEAATFSLCSKSDMGEKMKIDLDKEPWVRIGNPKATDFEALRISLLPGILKTVAANKHISLPLRMFEVADVVVKDSCPIATRGVGVRNQRHLCAINYNVKAGMEVVQGLLDNIMIALKVPFTEDGAMKGYYLEGKDYPSFLPGFSGAVVVHGAQVGRLGLVHPEVIASFNLNNPASVVEIDLQKVMELTNFGH
ncbi:Phenylalanine--tRNA ligase beta subunit [Chionoecetes opilio]|uniref:Phenylalanine--tRNA ligase beta subunit n=1 Tax=Chionoecetes opilio TaxID=41210 RepID=A0A8J4Z037_CHIOP|nr:Phenylalanine--tRNA ligase beta subunit [Chionoecetes opilio]